MPLHTQVYSEEHTSGAAPLPRRMTLFRCAGRDEAVGGKQQRARGAEPEPRRRRQRLADEGRERGPAQRDEEEQRGEVEQREGVGR